MSNRRDSSIGAPTRATIAALSCITLLAAGMRLYRVHDPLWLDELHTAWTASGSLAQVGPRARIGNQNPAYFYLTWSATRLAGMSELGVRLPSLVAGIVLVPVTAVMVYRWCGSGLAALLAASLVSIDTQLIFYSQEARPYAAVQLAGCVQIWIASCLLTIETGQGRQQRGSNRLRIGLIVTSTLLVYLHYTAALLLIAELVCWSMLATLGRTTGYRWNRLLGDALLIALLCIPATPHMLQVMERRENWWSIAQPWPTGEMLRGMDVYLTTPSLVLLAVSLIRYFWKRQPIATPPAVARIILAVCWLGVPLLVVWLSTKFELLALTRMRYVSVALLAPMVLAGFCCAACPTVATRGLCCLAVITAAVLTSSIPHQWRQDARLVGERNERWPAIVAAINDNARGRRWPVFLMAGLIEDHKLMKSNEPAFREYCLFPLRSLYRVETETRKLIPLATVNPVQLTARQRREIVSRGGAWLIIRAPQDFVAAVAQDIARQVENRNHKVRVRPRQMSGPVKLLSLQRSHPPH